MLEGDEDENEDGSERQNEDEDLHIGDIRKRR